jgi:hypothetical protein
LRKVVAGGVALIFGLLVLKSRSVLGQWKELRAPSMGARDLAKGTLSVDGQRDVLIAYEHQVCQAHDPCPRATRSGDGPEIARICRAAAASLDGLSLPGGLPPSVVANLELYRQSLRNGALATASAWASIGTPRSSGSFWGSLGRWEIDTCGYGSVPQRIWRLYELDQRAGTRLVTCKEIERLFADLPAKNE